MQVARLLLWDTSWPQKTKSEIIQNTKEWCRQCILLRLEIEQIDADINNITYLRRMKSDRLLIGAKLEIDIMRNLKILSLKELQDLWESKRNLILSKDIPTQKDTDELLTLRKEIDRRRKNPLPTKYVDFEQQLTD